MPTTPSWAFAMEAAGPPAPEAPRRSGLFAPLPPGPGGFVDRTFPYHASVVTEHERARSLANGLRREIEREGFAITLEELPLKTWLTGDYGRRILSCVVGERDLVWDRARTTRRTIPFLVLAWVPSVLLDYGAYAGWFVNAGLPWGYLVGLLPGVVLTPFVLVDATAFESDMLVGLVEVHGPLPADKPGIDAAGPLRTVVRAAHVRSSNVAARYTVPGRAVTRTTEDPRLAGLPREVVQRVVPEARSLS